MRLRVILPVLAVTACFALITDLVRLATNNALAGNVPWVRVVWVLGSVVAAWAAWAGRRWAAVAFLGALALSLLTFVPVFVAEWQRTSGRVAVLMGIAMIAWTAYVVGWRAR